MDWQFYQKSIDLSVEPDRHKLYSALKAKDTPKIKHYLKTHKYLFNYDNRGDFDMDIGSGGSVLILI